jgi:sensor histidine kinase YesM
MKSMQHTVLIFPRTLKQWFLTFGMIVLFGIIAFGLILGIKLYFNIQSTFTLYDQLFICFVYTTCIILLQTASGEYIQRKIPLNSKASAFSHVLIQSFSVLVAFYFAQRIKFLVYDECVMNQQATTIGLSISFFLSFIANTAYYIRYFYKQAQIAQQMATVSELSALRAQINPHFLFNTLNSIAALIRINPESQNH